VPSACALTVHRDDEQVTGLLVACASVEPMVKVPLRALI
jgi:hypothetical protein